MGNYYPLDCRLQTFQSFIPEEIDRNKYRTY